jgi:endonuclease/exonuclease/phosphatase family metal-dependent hydrolase
MSFDPYEPYGPVISSTMRVATWNVWGRFGDWEQRQVAIEDKLVEAAPDLVCLVESWSTPDGTQPERTASRLGYDHQFFEGDWQQDGWTSGTGLVSRWPTITRERRPLRDEGGGGVGEAVYALIDGERGPIQLFIAALDFPLGGSAVRQGQVRQLAAFIQEVTSRRHPTVLCGDFNAGPDSDEIRMLTGKAVTAAEGLVFYDGWEIAGDGTPGYTWSNTNPLAAVGRYPDRRFDYVLSAWPRLGAAGHPTACRLLGVVPPEQPQLSDHYGVIADLRY